MVDNINEWIRQLLNSWRRSMTRMMMYRQWRRRGIWREWWRRGDSTMWGTISRGTLGWLSWLKRSSWANFNSCLPRSNGCTWGVWRRFLQIRTVESRMRRGWRQGDRRWTRLSRCWLITVRWAWCKRIRHRHWKLGEYGTPVTNHVLHNITKISRRSISSFTITQPWDLYTLTSPESATPLTHTSISSPLLSSRPS